ncbi:hypothetical protein EST38_g372 [Candolleomyces aberdarensis]|uniref:Uncharacterized protein n=1 Tax=Candolleomyces aberdarensis TaxID=2316362 RepID=A0A4Q2DYZ8_9AGAR|nr:hypothetical protein EST38_g372 [Candolleomyces aberdarensis]
METSSYYTISDHDYELERDSPSPYPPSTPSLDSDSDEDSTTGAPHLANAVLRSSIAGLPEYRLRDIVLRLADKNPMFRRAIQREVAFLCDQELDTPPATPTAPRHSRKSKRTSRSSKSSRARRTKASSSHGIRAEDPPPPTLSLNTTQTNDCVCHPGHLEDEVYEFVSRTPNGAAFKVVQTVTMWSCCNEDEWSPGCILIAPTFGTEADKIARPQDHGGSKLESLNATRALVVADDDVYPDSELELSEDDHLVTPIAPRRVRSLA